VRGLLALALAAAYSFAPSAATAQSAFDFATAAEGRAVVSARDDYVRNTTPLERRALLRTAEPVSEERLVAAMAEQVLEWTDADRQRLQPLLARLDSFLKGIKPLEPRRILLVKTAPDFLNGSPHTRANAIILPIGSEMLRVSQSMTLYVLAHELFHVVSRANPALRERLYASFGFRRCASVSIPPPVADLRLTNPDAPQSLHTISVVYGGRWIDALPYVSFVSPQVDPREGFLTQIAPAWLIAERDERDACVVTILAGFEPDKVSGLFQQIGRNTDYLFGPEEILADNFALLAFGLVAPDLPGLPLQIRSPEVIEQLRLDLQ
jgi:hypothetical protein